MRTSWVRIIILRPYTTDCPYAYLMCMHVFLFNTPWLGDQHTICTVLRVPSHVTVSVYPQAGKPARIGLPMGIQVYSVQPPDKQEKGPFTPEK